jgi:hypothetical protein
VRVSGYGYAGMKAAGTMSASANGGVCGSLSENQLS